MSILLAQKAMEETAMRNGVSYEEVYMEIQLAIDAAIKSTEPSSRAFSGSIPYQLESLTPEVRICYICDLIAE